MKKVLFAMLVSGMLFSCTNNKSEEAATSDSTQVSQEVVPMETEELEATEMETTSAEVELEVDSTVQVVE